MVFGDVLLHVLTPEEAADLRGAAGPSACSRSTFGAAETQTQQQSVQDT